MNSNYNIQKHSVSHKFARSNAYLISTILAVLFLTNLNSRDLHLSSSTKATETSIDSSATIGKRASRGQLKNRTITLVHVGKAGGLTIKASTSLYCRLPRGRRKPEEIEKYIKRRFNDANNTLALQLKGYFHMWAYDEEELQQSTSFLFTLRNPVDRIISAYRYSHPNNCKKKSAIYRPKACENAKYGKDPKSTFHLIFSQCFPSAGMEDFAQSTMSPWNTEPAQFHNFTDTQRVDCRRIAREAAMGSYSTGFQHMYYNYDYYVNKTIRAFPETEIFGVRTEQEWEDMTALDIYLGGTGQFKRKGTHVSHGSEFYDPSPLSSVAYQKLCCVLEHEIQVYIELINRVDNLDDTAKVEGIDLIKEKCNIASSWSEWRAQCRNQIDKDWAILEPKTS